MVSDPQVSSGVGDRPAPGGGRLAGRTEAADRRGDRHRPAAGPAVPRFRYGTPPHGGLGLGLGRLLMLALGLSSIREATFLFRGPHRLEP
ncbi:amino acid--tRNA ligase-related protein [Kitasatospora sp. NPDC056651]|uniref:amino acid--tRNA ligase-related protein n=1 Tax=Kitasatospora sp. NPDC056651 TaxID=3345892 RepID=UPI003684C8AE